MKKLLLILLIGIISLFSINSANALIINYTNQGIAIAYSTINGGIDLHALTGGYNLTDVWGVSKDSDFVYHFNVRSGTNLTGGFPLTYNNDPQAGGIFKSPISNDFWIGDYGAVPLEGRGYIYHYLNGINQSNGFRPPDYFGHPIGSLSGNSSDFYVTSDGPSERLIGHFTNTGTNITNGFPLPLSTYGIIQTEDMFFNGSDWWVLDGGGSNFVYHINAFFENVSDGFSPRQVTGQSTATFNLILGNQTGLEFLVGTGGALKTIYRIQGSFGNGTQDYITTSQTFNPTATYLSLQQFDLNIQFNTSVISDITFNNFTYNATTYTSATTTSTTGNRIFSKSVTATPLGTNNFSWVFTINYVNGTNFMNTLQKGVQVVSGFNFSICGTGLNTSVFNFTTKEEGNKTVLNNTNFIGTFFIYPYSSSVQSAFSFSILNDLDGHFDFCTDGTANLFADATIQYSKTGYATRNYILDGANMSSNSLIDLYLLDSVTQTDLIVRVLDTNLFPESGVTVQVQRYFPDTNSWTQVDMGLSDDLGQVLVHVIQKTVDYRFVFTQNDVVVRTTDPMKILCLQDPLITGTACQIEFTIGTLSSELPFETIDGLSYSLTFSNNTKNIRFEWSDSSGVTPLMRLFVQNLNFTTASGKATICNSQTQATSGIMYCDISNNTGTFFAQVFRTASPENWFDSLTVTISQNLQDTFGRGTGVFAGLLIIMTVGLAGLVMSGGNPVVAILFTAFGVFAVSMLGLISLGYIAVISVFLLGIAFIIYMRI